MAEDRANQWFRPLVIGSSIVLLAASLYWARAILIPIVLATILTFTLAPLVNMVQRRWLPRVPAVLLVVLSVFLLVGLVCTAVYSQVRGLAEELPQHKERIVEKLVELREAGRSSWVDRTMASVKEIVDEVMQSVPEAEPPPPADGALPVEVVSSQWLLLRTTAVPAVEVLASAGLVIVLLSFMLVYREDVRNRIIGLLSNGDVTGVTHAVDDGSRRLSRFLLMQLVVNVAAGAALSAGLALLGVPYAMLWGVLLGLMRYVPYIGAWIACSLPVAYSIAVLPGWTQPLLVVALILLLELVISYVVEPWAFGRSIGTSALALLVSAAFWTWLWGPIGLLLSAPLTACLAVVGRHVPALQFLSTLLGEESGLEPHAVYYQRLLAHDADEAAEIIEDYLHDHSPEEAYEQVLLPCMVLTKRAVLTGRLSDSDERYVYQATRELVEEVIEVDREMQASDLNEAAERCVTVIGCPARDEADELALVMLQALVSRRGCPVEQLTHETLAGELVTRVVERDAVAVCIVTIPPKGIVHTRYLCKRLRAARPDLLIIVSYLGSKQGPPERVKARLRAAGADHVTTSLEETQARIIARVRSSVQSSRSESARVPVLTS